MDERSLPFHLDKGFLHERYINVVWAQFWFCTSMTVHVKAQEKHGLQQ